MNNPMPAHPYYRYFEYILIPLVRWFKEEMALINLHWYLMLGGQPLELKIKFTFLCLLAWKIGLNVRKYNQYLRKF